MVFQPQCQKSSSSNQNDGRITNLDRAVQIVQPGVVPFLESLRAWLILFVQDPQNQPVLQDVTREGLRHFQAAIQTAAANIARQTNVTYAQALNQLKKDFGLAIPIVASRIWGAENVLTERIRTDGPNKRTRVPYTDPLRQWVSFYTRHRIIV